MRKLAQTLYLSYVGYISDGDRVATSAVCRFFRNHTKVSTIAALARNLDIA